MEICIKQQPIWKAHKGMVIGDLQHDLGKDLMKQLEKTINKHAGKEKYFLLIHSRAEGNHVVKSVIMVFNVDQMNAITDRIPEKKLLGTICLYVNNRTGVIKKVWVLPHDIKSPFELSEESPAGEEIFNHAKGMLIANS